jgi:hypothetical protein
MTIYFQDITTAFSMFFLLECNIEKPGTIGPSEKKSYVSVCMRILQKLYASGLLELYNAHNRQLHWYVHVCSNCYR